MLHITGRREDGYHELETLFQMLDQGDALAFDINESGTIHRATDVDGVPEADDLVVRAALALKAASGCELGATIYIRKRLPMGGGLGGGSSDAATTLVALNALWGCGLSVDELAAIGLRLGADVPVFVQGYSAFAKGVGEALQPIELPAAWYVVLTPNVHISTAEVFSAPSLKRSCVPVGVDFVSNWIKSGQSELLGENVCELYVLSQQKEVANAVTAMAEFAPARMTGTGSSVFGRFQSEQKAAACGKYFQALGYQVLVAQGVNKSPLITALDEFQKLL